MSTRVSLTNFGGNVRSRPVHVLAPANEREVLASLDQLRGRRIRTIGRLHSCSGVVAVEDVVFDLRKLNGIALATGPDGAPCADIEAGCTIDAVIEYLEKHGRHALPTYPMFGGQTVAGAIATATHGSGRPSLSHYVTRIRAAAYSRDTGRAQIYEWSGGDELLASRCGLGCMGIVLSVRLRLEPGCFVEEHTEWHDRIEGALGKVESCPIQQFYLIPWSWKWFAQHRRLIPETAAVPSSTAAVQRALRLVGVDILFNGSLSLLSGRLGWSSAIGTLHRGIFPMMARANTRIVDRPHNILMMRHDFYRHVEMELFVPARLVVPGVRFLEWALRRCGGESIPLPEGLTAYVGSSVSEELHALQGTYVHDHAITVRHVLRDDTLISMTSGDREDDWYAVSLVTYQRDTAAFGKMCGFVSSSMAASFGARPHWGKFCPLSGAELARLYPSLPRFRACCAALDPDHVFVNDFLRGVLDF